MKTTQRKGKAAFTLIELMAVITIIVILAGLVIGGMGYVMEKQAKAKASVQIALLSKALEEYKLDMGTYPLTPNSTTGLQSATLFKALYWDSDNDGTGVPADLDQKIYLPDLDPLTTKQGWTSAPPAPSAATKIFDPWGIEYRYRTAMDNTTPSKAAPATENPDFDLWSSGKDGKTNVDPKHRESLDDIKNF
jgi:general secretion pathway protein G